MHRNIFYKDQAKYFPEVVRWDRCMVMKPNIFFFFLKFVFDIIPLISKSLVDNSCRWFVQSLWEH